jgi:hypothetical protein
LHLCMCIYVTCTKFILLPLSLLLPRPTSANLSSSHPGQNLLQPPIRWFSRRKNIKDKKRHMVFFLVWDKESYTRRYLVLFPCIYLLQPQLVLLYQTSSFFPSPLPMVAPTSLRFLYSFLYSEHINHIQIFGVLPFPYPSCGNLPLVWPMSHNIAAFVLGL